MTTTSYENEIPLMENPSFNRRMKNIYLEYKNEIAPYLTEAKVPRYDTVVDELSFEIKQCLPQASIHIFGSFANNFHARNSDIDFVIKLNSNERKETCLSNQMQCPMVYVAP